MIGYKAFNGDMTNRYGIKFELGKIYVCGSNIKFKYSGFHLCKNFEDTFRYFDTFNTQVNLCRVTGFGLFDCYHDEYYGFYDMYSFQCLAVDKILTRDDIISMALKLPDKRLERFVSLYRLRDYEIERLKPFSNRVANAIEYYQFGNTKVYERRK